MAKRGRPAKGKFDKLNDEWKANMLALKDETAVRKAISQEAMTLVALEAAKAADTDLISLQEQVKTASEMYSEGKKLGSLKIRFLIETLQSQGISVPSLEDFIKEAAEDVE